MDQNRLAGSVGVNGPNGLEGDPTAGYVEQLAAVLEAGLRKVATMYAVVSFRLSQLLVE